MVEGGTMIDSKNRITIEEALKRGLCNKCVAYYEDIEAPLTESAPTTEISTWNETRIINRFEKFCKENKLDHDKGLVILTKIIEKSNGKE